MCVNLTFPPEGPGSPITPRWPWSPWNNASSWAHKYNVGDKIWQRPLLAGSTHCCPCHTLRARLSIKTTSALSKTKNNVRTIFWKTYTWVNVTGTMTKCLPSLPWSRSSPSPHEFPEDPEISNRCNRCQSTWLRNERKVASVWYIQYLTVGPWVPTSPGLPCSPSSPWMKTRGKRKMDQMKEI